MHVERVDRVTVPRKQIAMDVRSEMILMVVRLWHVEMHIRAPTWVRKGSVGAGSGIQPCCLHARHHAPGPSSARKTTAHVQNHILKVYL